MPQWAGSCWYYLRFCEPGNKERFVGRDAERYWMSVDLYVGGTEHAVLHLLYARFWHKVLFDLGHLSTGEPFQRLVNQGVILGEDGRKMSKRWGNVIDPLDVIAAYGADAFRCYEMFMGPLEQMKPWSMTGVEGVSRFLARVWRLMMEENQAGQWVLSDAVQDVEPTRAQLKVIHATIKKVGEDIEALSFNTAIAQMMIFVNAFTTVEEVPVSALRTLRVVTSARVRMCNRSSWSPASRTYLNSSMRPMSTSNAGRVKRSRNKGINEWPPARSFVSSREPSRSMACSTDSATS
jgi:leucyl-tRNA synthetase